MIFALLKAGIALHHRANLAASLRIDAIYGILILLSGMASLILAHWCIFLEFGDFSAIAL